MPKRLAILLIALLAAACGGGSPSASTVILSSSAPSPTATKPGPSTAELTPAATKVEPTEEPTQPAEQQDLKVLEYGYTHFPGDTDYVQYGVILENPNKSGWLATYVDVTIAFLDKNGDVLTTEDETISNALPGQRVAIGSAAFDTEGVTKMSVQVDADWEEIDYEVGEFVPSHLRLSGDEYSTKVTGIMMCNFDKPQEYVTVVAILRNSSGRVIGGDHDIIENLRCNSTGKAFSIETTGKIRRAVKAEVYAST